MYQSRRVKEKGEGQIPPYPFGLGPWIGARVASQQCPVLRPGHIDSTSGDVRRKKIDHNSEVDKKDHIEGAGFSRSRAAKRHLVRYRRLLGFPDVDVSVESAEIEFGSSAIYCPRHALVDLEAVAAA